MLFILPNELNEKTIAERRAEREQGLKILSDILNNNKILNKEQIQICSKYHNRICFELSFIDFNVVKYKENLINEIKESKRGLGKDSPKEEDIIPSDVIVLSEYAYSLRTILSIQEFEKELGIERTIDDDKKIKERPLNVEHISDYYEELETLQSDIELFEESGDLYRLEGHRLWDHGLSKMIKEKEKEEDEYYSNDYTYFRQYGERAWET